MPTPKTNVTIYLSVPTSLDRRLAALTRDMRAKLSNRVAMPGYRPALTKADVARMVLERGLDTYAEASAEARAERRSERRRP
jgi:hypothetical protein